MAETLAFRADPEHGLPEVHEPRSVRMMMALVRPTA
jgi:hypothetical protein